MKSFSIVIPIFNESENIKKLIYEILDSLSDYQNFEIILVDDGSTDNSKEIINNFIKNNFIILVKHNNNLGQSKSILSGIKKAKYQTIVTLDGDGQNNPYDISKLLNIYFSNNFYLVGGIRTKRKDSIAKILSSKIANFVRSSILQDNCKDTGCSLKVFDKDIFLTFPFFDGIHRFLPALFLGFGYKTHFLPVDHRKRLKGKSKYGNFGRLFKGIFDLIKVKMLIKRNKKNL